MRNFDDIINDGVIRWTEREKESLYPTGHVPDDENGVFKLGNLMVIVTTEHLKGEIVECVSASLPSHIMLNSEDIEDIKIMFWETNELKDVIRVNAWPSITHLHRKRIIHTDDCSEVRHASNPASYSGFHS
ncbi:hypothetical protein [Pelosinus sp. sgz500959]|uniref:hypothetical protein n=1 Tax=Pelosinus sp. sgz500959 TaxID=3242472 RepID=UPI0036735B94